MWHVGVEQLGYLVKKISALAPPHPEAHHLEVGLYNLNAVDP
jgi:hypothetical protein